MIKKNKRKKGRVIRTEEERQIAAKESLAKLYELYKLREFEKGIERDNHRIVMKERAAGIFFDTLFSVFRNYSPTNIHFIDVKSYNTVFKEVLKGMKMTSYNKDLFVSEVEPIDYLDIIGFEKERDFTMAIGYPPDAEFTKYLFQSFELEIDFIIFVGPNSADNETSKKLYRKYGYGWVTTEKLPVDSFTYPNGYQWDQDVNIVVLSKLELMHNLYTKPAPTFTYGDIFDVKTININDIKFTEKLRPKLFKGYPPTAWSHKYKKYHDVKLGDDGWYYYIQHGINTELIGKCDVYLMQRYWRRSVHNDTFRFHENFESDLYGGIGYGLTVKPGFHIESDFENNLYIIYSERYTGVFYPIAFIDDEVIRTFYKLKPTTRSSIYIAQVKLINESTKGIIL